MFKKLQISTCTIVGVCNCEFDIDIIFNNLQIKDGIYKIKCNNKEKTKTNEVECKTFYNQITVGYEDNVNIKLFNNGNLQLSGVKDIPESRIRLEKLLERVHGMKGNIMIKTNLYRGIVVYKNKILKKYEDGYITHSNIKNDRIIIDNKICEELDIIQNCYVEKRHTNKIKKVYNCYGEFIGEISYDMIRKNKNLCIKGVKYLKNLKSGFDIVNKYNTKIGCLAVNLNEELIFTPLKPGTEVKMYYKCSTTYPEISQFNIANINSNTKFNLQDNSFLDRNLICEYLESKGIKYIYDSSKYPGVKFSIDDTKITIFRTGSILFSSKQDVTQTVLPLIEEIFSSNDFSRNNIRIKNLEDFNELSVWDLL